ncbi:MAG: flagellar protein FlaG [Candidatus Latescibacterota bacterium]
MMDGITTGALAGNASLESSRQRPRSPAGTESNSSAPSGNQSPVTGSVAVQPDLRTVERLAAELGTALNSLKGEFSVSVDQDSGTMVVRITDQATGEVVRQIPSKELLEADRSMERIIGLIVDDQA